MAFSVGPGTPCEGDTPALLMVPTVDVRLHSVHRALGVGNPAARPRACKGCTTVLQAFETSVGHNRSLRLLRTAYSIKPSNDLVMTTVPEPVSLSTASRSTSPMPSG